ncbi:hypothetical protein HDU98_004776 [Podochytrium sp. JEL0797]|nr:hypothetical protein HDU98_004776 [Podochytrium sp. JEL0797]
MTLGIPVFYALLQPIQHHPTDKTPTPTLFTKDSLSFFKLIHPFPMIDFTIRPLVWSRIETLTFRMDQSLTELNAKRKALRLRDQDPQDVVWMRNFLDVNSGERVEALNCVVVEVDVVSLDAEGNEVDPPIAAGEDQDLPPNRVILCGLAWTLHNTVLTFTTRPDDRIKSTAQSILSPARVLGLTYDWKYDTGEWDSAAIGRVAFKPTRLTRYVCEPEETRDWVVGELVEVRLVWVSGELGDQYVWWPAKILKKKSGTEYLVILHHSDTSPLNRDPIIRVTIAQLRNGTDPRATQWFPPARFLLTKERDPRSNRPVDQHHPIFRTSLTLMESYSLEMRRTAKQVDARLALKTTRASETVKRVMEPFVEQIKMVARLETDPNPDLWTGGVSIDATGYEVHFDGWGPRCATSALPCLSKSTADFKRYVEVEVLELGWSDDAGYTCLSLGPIPPHYPPFQLIGWSPKSIGYHSLNGKKLRHDYTDMTLQGIPYSVGDRVGFGMDYMGNVFFTRNGVLMFRNVAQHAGMWLHVGVSADGPGRVRVRGAGVVVEENPLAAARNFHIVNIERKKCLKDLLRLPHAKLQRQHVDSDENDETVAGTTSAAQTSIVPTQRATLGTIGQVLIGLMGEVGIGEGVPHKPCAR